MIYIDPQIEFYDIAFLIYWFFTFAFFIAGMIDLIARVVGFSLRNLIKYLLKFIFFLKKLLTNKK